MNNGRPKGRRSPCIANRTPIGARSPVLVALFRHMDEARVPITTTAEKIGTSKQQLHRMRTGAASPSIFMVECLANALGFDLVLKPRE